MARPTEDTPRALSGAQIWRRTRHQLTYAVLIFAVVQVTLRLDAIPLVLRFALLVLVSALLTAAAGWWMARRGDEHDREAFKREWAWARWLWRRLGFGRA